jgi:hypothetical protein
VAIGRRLRHAGRLLQARDEGTALTEFALAFLLYVTVVMGSIQIAMWAFTSSGAQFAVWEGCRAGVTAYQPAPPDATDDMSLAEHSMEADAELAAAASFAAADRVVEMMSWLPLTNDYENLQSIVTEDDVTPGEEGVREIQVSVRVRPLVLFPLVERFLGAGDPDGFYFDRSCRQRLNRFYSF